MYAKKIRIDAAGALHHIIARGIDRGISFQDSADKYNFLDRLTDIITLESTLCLVLIIYFTRNDPYFQCSRRNHSQVRLYQGFGSYNPGLPR